MCICGANEEVEEETINIKICEKRMLSVAFYIGRLSAIAYIQNVTISVCSL